VKYVELTARRGHALSGRRWRRRTRRPRIVLQLRMARQAKARGEAMRLPSACKARYGRLTVVLSPLAVITNTPVAVVEFSAYALQPDGGAGVFDMNGPATWP
jgi:hypothetical protein